MTKNLTNCPAYLSFKILTTYSSLAEAQPHRLVNRVCKCSTREPRPNHSNKSINRNTWLDFFYSHLLMHLFNNSVYLFIVATFRTK